MGTQKNTIIIAHLKQKRKGKIVYFMKIKILNTEHYIGSCNVEDIPERVTKYRHRKDVTFFYCHERDWIVLNEDNINYEFYKNVIENYLSLDNAGKWYMNNIALKANINIYKTLHCLNCIIRIRRKLYKNMTKKARRKE